MPLETSRRAVVAAAGTGVVAVGTLGPAAHAIDYTPGSWTGTRVLSARNRHLVSRFSYGVTQELAAEVRAAGGAHKWFERQLATAYDGSTDDLADWWPDLHLSPAEVWDRQVQRIRGGYRVMYDYGRRLLARRMLSQRPVLEVMTEFWENMLNVPANGDAQFTWRASYGDVMRKHALGRFDQLLPEAIVHPAMLLYLDGANSTKAHPNENLARELLELHTVGVGAFTEDDVKEAARILTGYRIDARKTWAFSYEPADHSTGAVRVLDFTHANADPDGRAVTKQLLRYLARHPRTARRIARRLAVTFVSDDPPKALVKRLAAVYLDNRTAIVPVLRALVASPEFAAAADRKVRDPGQDVVATFRHLVTRLDEPGIDDLSAASLSVHMADTIGLAPMTWPLPDGSPQANEPWSSPARVMASFDVHWRMATRSSPNQGLAYRAPVQWLPTSSPITLRDLVDHMSRTLHHRASTAALLQACCEAVELPPGEVITATHALVQSKMPRLLVVFLDHPTHFSR